jgi:hypothetical protein
LEERKRPEEGDRTKTRELEEEIQRRPAGIREKAKELVETIV